MLYGMLDDMRALANSVYMRYRALTYVMCFFVQGWLRCAELCFACSTTAVVDARHHTRTYGRADGAVLHWLDVIWCRTW